MTKSEKLFWGVMAGAVLVALCIELTPCAKKPVIPTTPAQKSQVQAPQPQVRRPWLELAKKVIQDGKKYTEGWDRQVGFTFGPRRPFDKDLVPARGVYRIVPGGCPSRYGCY